MKSFIKKHLSKLLVGLVAILALWVVILVTPHKWLFKPIRDL